MRVLGIDPGYERMGVAVIEEQLVAGKRKEVILYSSCVQTSSKKDHSLRLKEIGEQLKSVISTYKPNILSVESLFFTKNQKTAIKVAEARGVILYEASVGGLDIFELTPLQVKIAVTGYGRSDKSQVTAMVKKLVVVEKKKMLDDEFDAIAIALAGLASYPQRRVLLQK